jgi:hypothetical protein
MQKREKALAAAGGSADAAPVEVDSDDEAEDGAAASAPATAEDDDAAMSDAEAAPTAAATASPALSAAHRGSSRALAAASPAAPAAAAALRSPPMFAVDTTPAPDPAALKQAKAAALKAKNKENKKKGVDGWREKVEADEQAEVAQAAEEATAAATAENKNVSAEGVKLVSQRLSCAHQFLSSPAASFYSCFVFDVFPLVRCFFVSLSFSAPEWSRAHEEAQQAKEFEERYAP